MTLPPVVPCATCAGECWADESEIDQPEAKWAGPCWGAVEVIDEDYADDDDLRTWVHGCEAHRDRWEAYVPPPESGD